MPTGRPSSPTSRSYGSQGQEDPPWPPPSNGDANVPLTRNLGKTRRQGKDIPSSPYAVGAEELDGPIDTNRPRCSAICGLENYFESIKNKGPMKSSFSSKGRRFTKEPEAQHHPRPMRTRHRLRQWGQGGREVKFQQSHEQGDRALPGIERRTGTRRHLEDAAETTTSPSQVFIGEVRARMVQFDRVWMKTPGPGRRATPAVELPAGPRRTWKRLGHAQSGPHYTRSPESAAARHSGGLSRSFAPDRDSSPKNGGGRAPSHFRRGEHFANARRRGWPPQLFCGLHISRGRRRCTPQNLEDAIAIHRG